MEYTFHLAFVKINTIKMKVRASIKKEALIAKSYAEKVYYS